MLVDCTAMIRLVLRGRQTLTPLRRQRHRLIECQQTNRRQNHLLLVLQVEHDVVSVLQMKTLCC